MLFLFCENFFILRQPKYMLFEDTLNGRCMLTFTSVFVILGVFCIYIIKVSVEC